MRNKCDLGVLLIHGIGTQREGDTLIQFGEAIYKWLSDWLAGIGASWATTLRDATLKSPGRGAPASMILDFKHRDELVQCWLLAEGWWADTLQPPTFTEFAKWALSIIPSAVLLHFGQLARRSNATISYGLHIIGSKESWYYLWKGLREIASIVVMLPLGCLLRSGRSGRAHRFLVPALLPFDSVRSFLRTVQKTLSSTLGDSFVFISSPVQQAAAVAKVKPKFNVILDYEKPAVVARALAGTFGEPHEERVHNLGSFMKDHTSYWANRDQFVSAIVADLAFTVGFGSDRLDICELSPVDAAMMEFARQRRKWRLSKLVWMRRVAILASLGALIFPSSRVPELGAALKRLFQTLPASVTPRLQLPDSLATPAIVGVVASIVAIFIIYTLGVWGWRAWERREMQMFFSRSCYQTGALGVYIWFLATLSLLAISVRFMTTATWVALIVAAALLAIPLRRRGPARQDEWVDKLFEIGQEHLNLASDPREEDPVSHVAKACSCFALIVRFPSLRLSSSVYQRVLQGWSQALAMVPVDGLAEPLEQYDVLIAKIKRRGFDTSDASKVAEALRASLTQPVQAVESTST